VVAAAGLLAYHNSFAGAFVFDDEAQIEHNEDLRRPWPLGGGGLPQRPLLVLSLAANRALGGLEPWGYHAVNLAVHLLAGLTLYGLARRCLLLPALRPRYGAPAPWLALAAALLWLAHPLQTQAVTYVVQRGEAMAGLLCLLTLYAVLRGAQAGRGKRWWYAAAVLCCSLGMLSKEVMVAAPLLTLLFDRCLLAGSWREAFRRRWALHLALASSWLLLLPSLALAFNPGGDGGEVAAHFLDEPGAIAGLAEGQVSAGFGMSHLGPWEYARSQPGVILHYLRLAAWPDALCLDYGWPVARGVGAVLLPALVVGGLLLATLWALWRRPGLGFLAAAFFLALAPTSSVLPIADLCVEHRMYLPLAPLALLAVLTGEAVCRLLPARTAAWVGAGLLVAAVLALGWRTVLRNDDYRDPVALWAATAVQRPTNPRAYFNLGNILAERGSPRDAERQYRKALEIKPRYAKALCGLGVCLATRGDATGAERHFRAAVAADPNLVEARNNLAAALARRKKYPEAEEHLLAALRLRPGDAEAHYNLGLCLLGQKKGEEALRQFRLALRSRPDHPEARYLLGSNLARQGDRAEGVRHLKEAVRLRPGFAEAHYNLAAALVGEGNLRDAVRHFGRAVDIRPRFAEAHYNLGQCLMQLGLTREARGHFETAERINPRLRAPGARPPKGR
jgi:tetratricopeptide (TPR) repeat protein